MKGVGGPLLCIGDLLNDVVEGEEDVNVTDSQPLSSSNLDTTADLPTPDLTKLFQENYDQLKEALAGTDHSWTALTLKLCTALETGNKLVQSTNTNASLLLEKVGELQKSVKRGDSAIASTKVVHVALSNERGSLNILGEDQGQ